MSALLKTPPVSVDLTPQLQKRERASVSASEGAGASEKAAARGKTEAMTRWH